MVAVLQQCELGQVTCLVDGGLRFDADIFTNVAPQRVAAAGEIALLTEFNCFLLQLRDQPLTLVDAGCGSLFGDQGGRMAGLLADRGIAPGDIGWLILTHLHSDHFGGALQDGQPLFRNAEVVLHHAEAAFWAGQDHPAAELLHAYEAQIRLVDGGEDIAEGLRCWHLPGHTPGHSGLRIGNDLVLVADILHAEDLQLSDPGIAIEFDHDPVQAVETRRAALAEIAAKGLIYAGGHQMGPQKFGRLELLDPAGSQPGYRKVPA